MKQKLLLGLLLFFIINSSSQNSKISIEVNYPITVDNNFIGQNYNGIIDFGARFRFSELKIFNVGVSVNGGFLENSKASNNNPYDVKLYSILPRICAELNIESLSKFHPSAGLGYSFMVFNTSGINNLDPYTPNSSSSSQTKSGINLNLGTAYDMTDKIFAQVQFDFIKIGVDKEIPDIKYNKNINILKVGLGYQL